MTRKLTATASAHPAAPPQPPPLLIRVDPCGDHVVVTLAGELDIAETARLSDRLAALLCAGWVHIVLDLGGLEFCDAAGIGVMVRFRYRTAAEGGWLRLAACGPRIIRLLWLTRVSRVFATYDTILDAVLDVAQTGPTAPAAAHSSTQAGDTPTPA